ncbi:unnamed protein product [Cladocopium goreaui]|uniref:Uncharacterized protein n=1 Tax=Cladocopium goreaui TaxID=2562237 RepID=A0A9P1C410_9DINO|nr:unnamed protein product [Cladocopium goreaui]
MLQSSIVALNTAMKVCSFSGAPGAQKALLWLWASAEQLQPTAVTYSYVASALRSQHDSVRLLAGVRQRFLLDIKTISGQTRRPAERKCKRGRERERERN